MNLTFLNNRKRPSSAPRQKLIRRAAQLIIDPFQFFTFSRVWLSASWSGVRTVLYPNYVKFPPPLSLEDQYAFLPTGSTTAAVVVILQNITEMLDGNGHVIVISTDFTKLSANPRNPNFKFVSGYATVITSQNFDLPIGQNFIIPSHRTILGPPLA